MVVRFSPKTQNNFGLDQMNDTFTDDSYDENNRVKNMKKFKKEYNIFNYSNHLCHLLSKFSEYI